MTTRREIVTKCGAGLAAIIAAGRAPAALVRSLVGARNILTSAPASTPPTPPAYWGLCFTAEEPGVVVNMSKAGSPPAVTLETSRDGVAWTAFDADGGTTPITLVNIGDRVYFRAGASGNSQFAIRVGAERTFTLSGLCGASGNIMSLLSRQPLVALSSPFAFFHLFYGCTSLTAAPELPATTLATRCYSNMFSGCTSLAYIAVKFSSFIGTSYGFLNWVNGVAASGTFRCPTALGTDATISRGTSACPDGWTVVNTD